MIWKSKNCKKIYSPECTQNIANIAKKQGWKNTFTVVPLAWVNLQTKSLEFDTTTIIIPLKTKEHNVSKQLEAQLKKLNLKGGYDKDTKLLIIVSTNGWDQEYNLKDQVAHTYKRYGLLTHDGWTHFENYDEFILPLLKKLTFPGM